MDPLGHPNIPLQVEVQTCVAWHEEAKETTMVHCQEDDRGSDLSEKLRNWRAVGCVMKFSVCGHQRSQSN